MATSEAELHRALRDVPAIRQNFFFVLFLFGKEKGHCQTKISLKKVNAVALPLESRKSIFKNHMKCSIMKE